MEKELVKVGMEVRIDEQLYSRVSKEKYPENKFYVLCLVENTEDKYYLSDTEGYFDYKTFSIDCTDFEPYNSVSTYQVKDLEGNVIEEKIVEDNSVMKEFLPITQEFIEGFGYELIGKGSKNTAYDFLYRNGKIRLSSKGNLYTLSISENAQHNDCSVTFVCDTRLELRFLLTKGRINCSK